MALRDPLALFNEWFEDARAAGVEVPEAMTLATADAEGRPSARIVLLKSADERGFTFFTGYASRKGRELAENPRAALVFYCRPLGRQVRVEGPVRPGLRCLVVEDTVTSGGSTATAIGRIREEGLEVAGVVAVVDRLAGGAAKIEAAADAPYRALLSIDEIYPERPDRG